MSTSSTMPGIESLTLVVNQEIHVKASLETTFEALLEQIGLENETPEQKMPMKLEAWPGGRWFRDLGNDNGHLWGHVQVIKAPTLIELSGPMFMSYPAINHVEVRLDQIAGGTRVVLRHRALGLLEITGPLFMSYAVTNNLQYRLSEEKGGTLIRFHHKAFGVIQEEHRRGVGKGWTSMNDRIKQRAEAKKE